MDTYFLFSDNEVWHREILADTWRSALRIAREKFGIGGRLRVVERVIAYGSEGRDYRLDGTQYRFSLRKV